MAYAYAQSYVTHLGEPATLGRKMWAKARERHWAAADKTQVLGDGAVWIWNLANEFLLPKITTTDWYNAAETLLFQGHAEQISAMLSQRAALLPNQADSLRSQATASSRLNCRVIPYHKT